MDGERCQQPRQRDLPVGGAVPAATVGQRVALQSAGTAAEREERHVGDARLGAGVDEVVVTAHDDVVRVLHLGDRRDGPGLGELLGSDVAHAEMLDQALLLELGQHLELVREREPAGRALARRPAG